MISIFKHDTDKGAPVSGYPGVVGYHETSYEGAVLATRERNYHDDSDFYAVVWDEATGTIKTVDYATTRGWTYLNGASVDATPDVIEKANAFARARYLDDLKDAAAAAAREVGRGKRVRVVKGRKVPKGTEGEVFWVGEGRYYGPVPRYRNGWSTAGPKRVGFKADDGTVYWTAASNLEVTDPEEWLPDLGELEAKAARADWSYVAYGAARARGLVVM